LQDPPKFTLIGIFGLKVYHLATLFITEIAKKTRLHKMSPKMKSVFFFLFRALQVFQVYDKKRRQL
jgi:hypothetical protein